jgi:exodeoxyribonuclease-3
MKIITLNLNGIRAASRKGFFEWLQKEQPDYVCLQELKAHEVDLTDTMMNPKGYFGYFSFAQKKGYSGVGIYSKTKPEKVISASGIKLLDDEGRFIQVSTKTLDLISLYLPSGSSGDERQQYKFKVMEHFYKFLSAKIKTEKAVLICGDYNIAHHEIDLKNYKGNRKNSGFLPEEREWMTNILTKLGWVDVYRSLYPERGDEGYTWWSNRGQAWAKNVGWRIDYHLANLKFYEKATWGNVFKAERFSDHAPLIIDYSD